MPTTPLVHHLRPSNTEALSDFVSTDEVAHCNEPSHGPKGSRCTILGVYGRTRSQCRSAIQLDPWLRGPQNLVEP